MSISTNLTDMPLVLSLFISNHFIFFKKKTSFQTEGEDELKKKQLMELAIINGTYKDSNTRCKSEKNEFIFI